MGTRSLGPKRPMVASGPARCNGFMENVAPLIAVVDDEESVRRALARLLRSAQYQVEGFASARAFLESLALQVPQCIVLDLHMPEVTGLELQQRLRQLEIRIPVIVITAYDEPDSRDQCLALGAERYFAKPVDGHRLIRSIRQLVTPGRAL